MATRSGVDKVAFGRSCVVGDDDDDDDNAVGEVELMGEERTK